MKKAKVMFWSVALFLVAASVATATEKFTIIGPKIVKVGQVAHFSLVDCNGQLMFKSEEESLRGEVIISDGRFVKFIFDDRNALSVSVMFTKKGSFFLLYKKEGGPLFKVEVVD